MAVALHVKYYVGRPCRRGQHVVRYTGGGHCVQRQQDRQQTDAYKRYQANYHVTYQPKYMAVADHRTAASAQKAVREDSPPPSGSRILPGELLDDDSARESLHLDPRGCAAK